MDDTTLADRIIKLALATPTGVPPVGLHGPAEG